MTADRSADRETVIDRELTLHGPTVVARPPVESDVVPLWEAIDESVTDLCVWMRWCHEGYRPEETRVWLRATRQARAEGRECSFVVTDAVDGTVLGACALNDVDAENRRANLGYWVRSTATGRGVATEAAGLVARFGLTVLGLARVEIVAAPSNLASQRVAEKVGARREGILRNRFWLNGESVDAVVFSLVPSDLHAPPLTTPPGDGGDGRREPR